MSYSSITSIATNSTLVLMDDTKQASSTNITSVPSKEFHNETPKEPTTGEYVVVAVFMVFLLSILVGLLRLMYKTRGI